MNGPKDTCLTLDRYLNAAIAVGATAAAVGLATGGVHLDATLAVRLVILVGLGALAVVGIVQKVRIGRAARAAAEDDSVDAR